MRITRTSLVLGGLLVGALALVSGHGPVRAQDKPDEGKKAAPVARASFERLTKLAGDWYMPEGDKPFFTYRVVSAGSVVLETIAPGTPHEMVTLYHMDGEDLVLTHYCAGKNQPHMKAQAPFGGKTLAFRFTGGTNIDASKDVYMGDLDLTFVGDDELKAVWTSYKGKAKDGEKIFELKRKK